MFTELFFNRPKMSIEKIGETTQLKIKTIKPAKF